MSIRLAPPQLVSPHVGRLSYLVGAAFLVAAASGRVAAQLPPGGPGYGPWVFLMCDYPDRPEQDSGAVLLERFLTASDGLWSFFDAISYGQFEHDGSSIIDSVILPHPEEYYNDASNPVNVDSACLLAADPRVYYPSYHGAAIQLNGSFFNFLAYGGQQRFAFDGTLERLYGVALYTGAAFPALGSQNLYVYAHEIGHGLGLNHAKVRAADGGEVEYSMWDLMGFQPVQLGAPYMEWLGWMPPGRVQSFPAGTASRTSLELVHLADPPSQGLLMLKAPLGGGSPDYYTVEARKRVGVDVRLLDDGLLVKIVDTVSDDAPISHFLPVVRDGVEAPVGYDGLQPGDTFSDSLRGFFVEADSVTADGYALTVTRGWPAVVSVDGPGGVAGLPSTERCTATCAAVFAQPGETVNLTPDPDAGEPFAGWAGDCAGTAGCTVTVDGLRRVTAVFAPPFVVLSEELPTARAGAPYEAHLAATDDGTGVVWTVDTVTTPLPDGIELTAEAGVLNGVPTRAGPACIRCCGHVEGSRGDRRGDSGGAAPGHLGGCAPRRRRGNGLVIGAQQADPRRQRQ
jgi:hypothetical protein